MSQQPNGTPSKAAQRDGMSMRGTAEYSNTERPQSFNGTNDHFISKAQEACKQLELLLRETVHRCSNDLQLVVSLLSLQAKRIKSREGRIALEDAAVRIGVLARARAQSAGKDNSGLATALRQICEALQAHAELQSVLISLEIGTGCDEVDSSRVAPIGLAVNELATNAIKHAFNADKGGKITIFVHRRGNYVIVQVDDDGLPFPDTHPTDGHGLGLGLVRRLVASCGGQFHQPPPGSKTFEIVVPNGPAHELGIYADGPQAHGSTALR